MKTFARKHYENVYDELRKCLEIYDISSIDQILTTDPTSFKSMYELIGQMITDVNVVHCMTDTVSEMNQYGTSLKFYVPNDFVCKVTLQEALDTIRSSKLSNGITISLDDAFATLSRTNICFVYENREYVCKQIVYITEHDMLHFLVPLNSSTRLFVIDYLSRCDSCREVHCIVSSNEVKLSFESYVPDTDSTITESKICDIHRSECEIGYLMKRLITILGDALKQYGELIVGQKADGEMSMLTEDNHSNSCGNHRDSEYFVKLNRNMMLDLNSVKHVTSDEKKNLKLATGFTSQKVMKFTQEDE